MKKSFILVFALHLCCINSISANIQELTNALQALKTKLGGLASALNTKEAKDPLSAALDKIVAVREGYAKSSSPQPLLKSLTTTEQAAGVNTSECYNPSLKNPVNRVSFNTLHKEGNDKMTGQELQQVFFLSMFQYYTNDFLRFNMTYDYLQARTQYKNIIFKDIPTNDRLNFGFLRSRFNIQEPPKTWFYSYEAQDLITTIQSAITKFKENKLFAKLAGAYQRWKVVVEKVENPLADANRMQDLLKIDRITTDLQIMIFHWMREGYEKFVNDYKSTKSGQAGDFLAEFKPSFLEHPYYKTIMSQLDILTQPVTLIEGINITSRF